MKASRGREAINSQWWHLGTTGMRKMGRWPQGTVNGMPMLMETNSSLIGLQVHSTGGNNAWYKKASQLSRASEVVEDNLLQPLCQTSIISYYSLNFILIITYKYSYNPLSKKLRFKVNRENSRKPQLDTIQKSMDGEEPSYIYMTLLHLQFRPQGREGLGKMLRTRRPGSLLL